MDDMPPPPPDDPSGELENMDLEDVLGDTDLLLPRLPDTDAFDDLIHQWLESDARGSGRFTPPSTGAAPAALASPFADREESTAGPSQARQQSQAPAAGIPSTSGQVPQEPQGILTRSRSRRLASGEYEEDFPSRGGSAGALGSSDVASEEGSSSSTSRGDGRRRTEGGEKRVSRARSVATAAAERGKQLMSAPVSMLVGAAQGGAKGLQKSLRKRSKDPEEIREKERARNRRAQARFRERQKERMEERTTSMRQLQLNLDQLAKEKADLEARNQLLEQSVAVTHLAQPSARPTVLARSVTMNFAQQFELSEDGTVKLTVKPAMPLELTPSQVQALSWQQHASIWKDYVEGLRTELEELGDDEAAPSYDARYDRITELVKEISMLQLCFCQVNAKGFCQFQSSKLDAGPDVRANPPLEFWASVKDALGGSEEQVREALEYRRTFLTDLGGIIRNRWEIYRVMQSTLEPYQGEEVTRAGLSTAHREVLEASEKLMENLKEEQALVVQGMSTALQGILTPKQKAIKIVASWPYVPDVLNIVGSLAAQTSGEPTVAELLGVASLPPMPFVAPYGDLAANAQLTAEAASNQRRDDDR